jgi:hypothetical protein
MARTPFCGLFAGGNFTLRLPDAMFRVRRYQTSQNGVLAILRVQGRALPPTAEVI